MARPERFDGDEGEGRVSPSGLPWPETWSLPKVNGWLRIGTAAAFGAVCLAISVDVFTGSGEDAQLGWACLMVVVICVLSPVWFRLSRGRGAVSLGPVSDGSVHQGVPFPNRRAAGPAVGATLVAAGTLSIMLTLSTDPGSSGDPVLLFFGLLMLAVSPVTAILGWMDKGVVLTPQAIIVRQRGRARIIPWGEIAAMFPNEYAGGSLFIRLILEDDIGRRARFPLLGGGRNNISVIQQRNDPALVLHAIRFYLANPDKRHELAEPAAVARLAAGDLQVSDAPGTVRHGWLRRDW